MDGGAGLGLWLQAGLVHEVNPWWGTGVGGAARGRLSLAHVSGSHPRVKGQTLLGPDHFPSTTVDCSGNGAEKCRWGLIQHCLCRSPVFSGRMQLLQKQTGEGGFSLL